MVRSSLLWTSLFVAGLLAGASCADEDECTPGYEGCVCASGACLDGLACLSSYCVDPDWTPPTDDAADTGDDVADTGDDTGSGGSSPDNVAACNALLDELGACGDFDLTSVIDCSIYADYTCDVADYLDCIREAYVCVDGVPDTSGFLECTELATCT